MQNLCLLAKKDLNQTRVGAGSMKSNKSLTSKSALLLTFLGLWSIAALVAMIWGTTYNWPDYVHVNYGIPFVWGTHTLNTFIGPVDRWSFDLSAMVLDLAVWLFPMILGAYIIRKFKAK